VPGLAHQRSLATPNPIRDAETKPSGRRKVVIVLAIASFLLLAILVAQASFNLKFISPDSNQQLFFFATLTGMIFFTFVAMSLVLGRNLLKLYAERRQGVAGSKFRTRLVVVNLLLSFLPVIAMFWFSYGLMNRSIDKWFSQPVEEVRADTAALSAQLYDYAGSNATSEAVSIAQSEEFRNPFVAGNFKAANEELKEHMPTLQGGFVVALSGGAAVVTLNTPAPWQEIRDRFPVGQALRGEHPQFQWGQTSYIVGAASAGEGTVLVAMLLPPRFAETARQIQESQQRYVELARQRKLVRRIYLGFLLLLTVLVLFASTWLALFLSKLVNRPVAAIAAGTEAISKGQLDYRVDIRATDELAELVQSFNSMAEQLESSRRQIEASSRELGAANEALEGRRHYIETVLESIPTGVVSIDGERRVTLANAAFCRMFHPERTEFATPAALAGMPLRDLLPAEVVSEFDPLLRRADRMGITASNMEITLPHARLNAAVTVAALEYPARRLGYVLVFEDLSDLLRAQKQAAWSEVARRVAHEIKNPLTPIALSAERIHRHLTRGSAPDPASLEVIRGCAETIGNAVQTVRSLVDEFSVLARFPASHPQPANLNRLVESALVLFNGRLEGIRVRTDLAPNLPEVMADPEAIKRAVANLVDNAAEAMQDAVLKEITVATALVASRDAVELAVSDTGHGVSRDVKERLFLPYFSTKQRGTGLGLAIVSRIVEDHNGSIRVEENKPVGSRFVIELPVAVETLTAPAAN
jgi:two-component system, NtrC family, nitrogen regulation sensor histidine kinase NtrY